MKSETLEMIYQMQIRELWNYFLVECEDSNLVNQIKHGIVIKIPIYYLINEWYESIPHNNKVRCLRQSYSIVDFETEKDQRCKKMREYILSNNDEEGPMSPR